MALVTHTKPATFREAAVGSIKKAIFLWCCVMGSYALTTLMIHLTYIYLPILFPEGFVLTMPW